MNEKLFLSEKTLKQFLALLDKQALKDHRQQLNLLYQLAPEIKTPHQHQAAGRS
jgi:CRISPR/Cas system Type II protein with McrA/HNH and RuvC-like nuclease domain